ncbi:3-oxoacyl-[acyl-carrier-protein] reductase FabG [Enhygromyxa salina]|uniref:3-oxoacyl-[acyl-carrier-protein] reductase FabG n=1 Tax=Enhygromyxa salina TaxID=215803 RepID=A0A2S9XBA3_9BACT|nr:SDR family NAD(P)-dependent oxidoreductase [Enhygromyxa salina]PRP90133.1 3-oxoacyl-[acyl-carrier-protein] reductase FabG [Enhygromyxa salina]
MALDLRQRKVLLTGASRGLGAHIARGLAERGATLILTARDETQLADTAAACEALGAPVTVLAADLARADERASLSSAAGEVDILINNAGVEYTRRLLDQTDAQVEAQLALNLTAPIDLTRRALPGMIARGRGTIVNVSSMSGKGATPYNSVYAATKSGLTGFSASLRIELLGTGVHVAVVCPGFVSAGMWGRTGLRAPLALREVKPEKVSRAVLRAIDGAPEVLVTAGPVRPLLALRELFPGIEAPALRAMGILRALERRADALEQTKD